MSTEKTLIASLGVEGGGFDLYALPDGKIIESGSSGGMMGDDEEDPIRQWEQTYESLDAWWTHFTEMNKNFWYYFHISDVNPDYKEKLSSLALASLRPLEIRPESFENKETLERKWELDEREYWR
jgi:hypothetical protein